MTNAERIQARIARDKAKKYEKHRALYEQCGRMENVATLQNLLKSTNRRIQNTSWKGSVQGYVSHFIVKNNIAKRAMLSGRILKSFQPRSKTLTERGKRRDIQMVDIASRVIQGVLCDAALSPITEPTLIFDNPASVKDKGVAQARRRLEHFLHRMIRKHGRDFWVWTYDFKGFFEHIRHRVCYDALRPYAFDKPLRDYIIKIVMMYQEYDAVKLKSKAERETAMQKIHRLEGQGLTLGSQISQVMALVAPSMVDHTAKDVCGLKCYERYMDDGIAFHHDRKELERIANTVCKVAESIGLEINPKKTKITKVTNGFVYLKIRYTITDTGHVVKRLVHSTIVRRRRTLARYRRLVDMGRMTLEDVFTSVNSWMGNARQAHSTRTRKRVRDLYRRLYHYREVTA